MISWRKLIILFVFHLCPTITIAYEVKTHEFITSYSINRSELVDPSSNLLSSLGFEHNIFSKKQKNPNSRGEQSTIFELIKFGSRFEDNTDELFRPLNHFYDPQNEGRPLTILLFGEIGINSFNWILAERTSIPLSQQNYSYSDANNYLKEALTSLEISDRESNWGLTFQTLGQLVHHIQDMAQPQHVRNDAHCNEPWCALILKYRPSLYELITAKSQSRLEVILGSNRYPDIDLNVFNTAGSFWNSDAPNSVTGLAEFTSTNFVSAGTNFEGGVKSGSVIINVGRNSEYPSPGTDNLTFTTQSIPGLLGPDLPGEIQFAETQVTDTYDPSKSQVNQRASSFSIFDSNLESTHIGRIFSLNIFNYDAAHEFLIPRAVAYSAGLIDYFFRGRISSAITVDGDGIEITNTSNGGVANPSSPTTFQASGAFEVYYETNTGEHKPLMSLTNLALESSLPVNGIHTITGLTAALQSITDLGDEGNIIILFDGDIGSERGLAVAITIIEKTEVFLGRFGVQYYGSGSTRGQSREIRFNDKLDTIDRMDFVRMPKNGRFICDGGAIIDLSDTTYSTTVNYNLGSAYAGYISAVILSYDPLRVASYFYYVEFRAKGVNTSFDQVIIRSSNPLPPNYFTYFEDKGILNLEFCNYYGVVQ